MTALLPTEKTYSGIMPWFVGLASLASGAILLVWSSPWAPLLLTGAAGLALVGFFSLAKPEFPLLAAIIIVYFPRGAVNDDIYSLSFDAAVGMALLGFLLAALSGTRRIRWCGATLFMVLFVAWSCVTLMWSANLVSARQQLVQYALDIALLFLLHNLIDSRARLDLLLRTLAAGGLILAIAGLAVILLTGIQPGGRLKIFDVNENLVPTLLILALPGVLLRGPSPGQRSTPWGVAVGAAFLCATLLLIVLTGSRGGLLSLLTALLILMMSRQTRGWGLLGLALGLGALMFAPQLFSIIEHRLLGEGGLLGGRTILWETGLMVLSDLPFGAGIGNGKAIVPDYLNSIVGLDTFGVRTIFSTHNPLLDVGIDTGYPGMLLYLAAIFAAIASFARRWLSASGVSSLPIGYHLVVFAAGAGYSVSWIRDGAMNHHPSFFVMLALLVIPTALEREKWPSDSAVSKREASFAAQRSQSSRATLAGE